MRKICLIGGLVGTLCGCTAKEEVHEPYSETHIPVRIISYSPHALRWKAPVAANVANDGLRGAFGLWPVDIEYKATAVDFEGPRHRIKACEGALCVYLFKSVGYWDSEDQLHQADGLYLKSEGVCNSFIVVRIDGEHDDTLLHEVGHAFGLEHDQDPSNVMTTGRNWDARLTNAQLNIMRYHALRWREHCLNE